MRNILLMSYGDLNINFESFEKVQANLNDYKITININGQTLLEYDKNRERIKKLFSETSRVMTTLNPDDLAEISGEQTVGLVYINGVFNSDGEVNIFNLVYDLFVCDFEI